MLLPDALFTVYHNEELKSLTRYRFDKVRERAKLKTSITRLVCILFPELEKLVPTLHMPSIYALLDEFPGTKQIANANLTRLKHLLADASKGHYGRDMAVAIREAARNSIGSVSPAKSLELRHTIHLIRELDAEITEIELAIQNIMDELHSPITSIPGMGFRMAAMILAEVGDFSRFDLPDKVLAFAGLSPSTYQSGQMNNCYAHMEKRGSRYLRFALYNATKCNLTLLQTEVRHQDIFRISTLTAQRRFALGRRKKLINGSDIPQHEVETIARCLMPDIIAFFESEEGQREFAEWKAWHNIEDHDEVTA